MILLLTANVEYSTNIWRNKIKLDFHILLTKTIENKILTKYIYNSIEKFRYLEVSLNIYLNFKT